MGNIGQRVRGGVAGMVAVLGVVCFLPGTDALAENERAPAALQADPPVVAETWAELVQPDVRVACPMNAGCQSDPTPEECKRMHSNCAYTCYKNACVKEGRGCDRCRNCCSTQLSICLSEKQKYDFGGCQ